MKYTYDIQCPFLDDWVSFVKGRTKSYCDGYLDALEGQLPRQNLRMVRSDGKIVREIEAYSDVGIGMVAGWPTAEQYENAAEKALERAKLIRERNLT